jgi:hypothetical protein
MRIVLGFLAGLVGMIGGWVGLEALVLAVAGPDRDGGIAMGAFFQIGPLGGLVGFVAGIWLFIRFGVVRRHGADGEAGAVPRRTRVSRRFALGMLAIVGALGWWGWYGFIRSPYLSHGFMMLDMQFKLPAGVALPADGEDVHIVVGEAGRALDVSLGRLWRAHVGDRRVILASVELSMKTRERTVSLDVAGVGPQHWVLDLPGDPDPTDGFGEWRAGSEGAGAVDMDFRLRAER